MIVGHTPWETDTETKEHDRYWLSYYQKAATDFLGRTPDRTIIEHDVPTWPASNGLYRLRMEWDARS